MLKLRRISEIPKGFRHLTDEEVAKGFLNQDVDRSYTITKNEWMTACLKVLVEDVSSLDSEAPDAIMSVIKDLSDEFDKYDSNNDKAIDYLEYKDFLMQNILISE